MEFHEIANCFPLMVGPEYDELVASVRRQGLIFPVTMHEAKILDGRNRYRACTEVDEEPRFEDYAGDDPVGFVAAANLARRHLNASQRAFIAANLANLKAGGSADGSGGCLISSGHPGILTAAKVTLADAAKKMNVSERSIKRARSIQINAPDLAAAINSGKLTINAAEETARGRAPKNGKWDEAITAVLLEDSQRSERVICRVIGAPEGSHRAIIRLRKALEKSGQIEPYLPGGTPYSVATRPKRQNPQNCRRQSSLRAYAMT